MWRSPPITTTDWKTCQDLKTHDTGLGIHPADFPLQSLPEGTEIKFTFYWPDAGHWEDKDFMVRIATWCREAVVPSETKGTDEK